MDQRIENYGTNRQTLIQNLAERHYPPLSVSEQFIRATAGTARGLDPVPMVQALSETLQRPTTLVEWVPSRDPCRRSSRGI